jgi:fatty acid desaturase
LQTKQSVIEWPTLFVMIATYLMLGWSTTWLAHYSLPLAIFVTGIAIAQFSSLQHEVLHGHPFQSRFLSEAAIFPGVTVYIPYIRFKDTHLAHHHDPILTDPYDDPESNFLDPAVWNLTPKIGQLLLQANNTLLGRILLGPAVSIWSFVGADIRAILMGNRHILTAWLLHGLGVGFVLAWLWGMNGMPVWAYLLAAYFGFGLLKIRTFLEHRAHDLARARSVVIEDKGFFALLFLNNNFHSVHHSQPGLAWYHLPRLFAENREHFLTRNDGYFYQSYVQVFRQYFFHRKDPVPHPLRLSVPKAETKHQANLRKVGTGPELSKNGTPD